jgi:hypothetical protein
MHLVRQSCVAATVTENALPILCTRIDRRWRIEIPWDCYCGFGEIERVFLVIPEPMIAMGRVVEVEEDCQLIRWEL